MTTPRTDPAEAPADAPVREPRWPYAVSGVLAAVAGMAAGHLVAAVVNPPASPVLAVGSAVIDATPTPVKEWAVQHFGTADKPILLGSVTLVTLVVAALIGLVARRHPTLGLVLLLVLASLAGTAALMRPGAGQLDVVPGLVTALAGLATLSALRRLIRGREQLRGAADRPLGRAAYPSGAALTADRRQFLVGAAGVTAAAAGAGALGQKLAESPSMPAATSLPHPSAGTPPLPTGLEKSVPGLSAFRTPNASFYRVDTALIVPRVDAASWRLHVDGQVEHPFSIGYAELLAMPMVERDITMTCVSNDVGGGYIGSARWLGVRTADLLRRAGVQAGADQILSTSTDGMTISTPVQALTDDRDAMVAVAMNGQPLPVQHGFPARLVTPGLYGYVGSTKWVTRLTATTYAAQQAYWAQRGWAPKGPIRTESRIDTPKGLSNLKAGAVTIAGVAWAQRRGIKRVQVRVDGGSWIDATLGPNAGIDYWRQWYLRWSATPGRHTLTVRATDGHGEQQTATEASPFPSGATGWHSVVVFVA